MYLYNGHRAPGLPVYDPGELPYGLIVSANADNTALILMLCVNRPYYGTNPSDSTKTGVYNTGRMKVYTCTDTEEAWTFSMETENALTANDDDPGGGVLWTLEDILKTDGSVWMAGTQPVPERVSEAWVRSFQEGLALGLTGAPLPYTGKAEPVAYLYNGVRLPPLPEWDKAAYPYAFLVHIPDINPEDVYNDESYVLLVTALRPQRYSSGVVGVGSGGYGYSQHYTRNDPFVQWNDLRYNGGATLDNENGVFWANTDILNEEGTLFFAASDPVPVYE